jgi:hypothetical protein
MIDIDLFFLLMIYMIGLGFGLLFGLFLSSVGAPGESDFPEGMRTREKLKIMARQMGQSSWSMAKNFSLVGFLLSGSSCMIGKVRKRHDMI